MKKLASLAIALIAALGAFAQPEAGTFSLTPTVAFNTAELTGNVYDAKYQNYGECQGGIRLGFAVGVDAGYQVSKKFAVSAGVFYSLQGSTRDYSIKFPTTGYEYKDQSHLDLSYIKVPILANVYLFKGFAVKAGIQPGILVAAKDKVKTTSTASGETKKTVDRKDNFNTVDFSIPVGLSYEFRNGLMIGARYEIGLTDVVKSSSALDKAGKSGKNSVLQISLGYKFKL